MPVAQSFVSITSVLLSSEMNEEAFGSANSIFKFLGGRECVCFDYYRMLSAWNIVETEVQCLR